MTSRQVNFPRQASVSSFIFSLGRISNEKSWKTTKINFDISTQDMYSEGL